MDKSVLIIGTGAQAKYALDIFRLQGVRVVGLIAVRSENNRLNLGDSKIYGGLEVFDRVYSEHSRPALLLCSSSNETKEELVERFSDYEPSYANAVHPTAVISSTVKSGHGIIVNANAVIQPYANIGNHVMIHAGVIVEHDCIVEDYVNLAPRVALAGHVKVGKGTTLYTGAVVAPTVEIGEYSVVGAGGVLLKGIGNRVTAVGIPARVVGRRRRR